MIETREVVIRVVVEYRKADGLWERLHPSAVATELEDVPVGVDESGAGSGADRFQDLDGREGDVVSRHVGADRPR